jgi:hypothetical protein
MGLLDFKFLILLGLAIVIYFIYKELELHRDRLTFCEEKIKELKHLTFNENNIIPLNPISPHVLSQHHFPPHPSPHQSSHLSPHQSSHSSTNQSSHSSTNQSSHSSTNQSSHSSTNQSSSHYNNFTSIQNKTINDENKNLSILLPIKSLNQSIKNTTETSLEESSNLKNSEISESIESVNLSLLSENKNFNLNNNSESKRDSELKRESESKHLEIYSNDNDNNLETSISDSLMVSKKTENLKILQKNINDYTEKSDLEQIINNNDLEQQIINNNDLEQQIINNNDLEQQIINNNDLEQKIIISDSEQLVISESNNSEKSDSNILSKMKLIDLQNIARKKKLSLDKKINGHQKKKTKQELIDELSKN